MRTVLDENQAAASDQSLPDEMPMSLTNLASPISASMTFALRQPVVPVVLERAPSTTLASVRQ